MDFLIFFNEIPNSTEGMEASASPSDTVALYVFEETDKRERYTLLSAMKPYRRGRWARAGF